LDRRLGALRFFHQADDLRQGSLFANFCGLELDQPQLVQRGPVHRRAWPLLHRDALAGQHRLVYCRAAFDDYAVHRDLFARAGDDYIANPDIIDLNVHLLPTALYARGFRAQPH